MESFTTKNGLLVNPCWSLAALPNGDVWYGYYNTWYRWLRLPDHKHEKVEGMAQGAPRRIRAAPAATVLSILAVQARAQDANTDFASVPLLVLLAGRRTKDGPSARRLHGPPRPGSGVA
jgi:hypothetical protein